MPGNISAYIGNRALNLCVHIEYQFFIWGAGYSQKHFFKYGLNNRGFFLCNNSNKQICMLNINLLHKHFCGRKSYCKRKHSDIQQSIWILTEYQCHFPYNRYSGTALQTIFHLCIPKKDLAKPHFFYQLNISKTKSQCSVWNYDILQTSTKLKCSAYQLSA